MESGPADTSPAAFPFPATLWSRVLRTREHAAARAALEDLCRIYWQPVLGYLRALGAGPNEAEDIAQDFFATFLRRDGFQRADQERGTLRSYLKGAIRHHLLHWRRDQAAQRRGGAVQVTSLDAEDTPDLPAQEGDASLHYDQQWALTVMARALAELRAGYEHRGRLQHYDKLKQVLFQADHGDAAELAADLGMTRGALTVELHRARKRLAALLRAEVEQTVDEPAQVDAELSHLLRVLGRLGEEPA